MRGLPPATVAWLSTPLPCSVNSPAGGKKNPFVYSTAPQEARRQLIAKLEAEVYGLSSGPANWRRTTKTT